MLSGLRNALQESAKNRVLPVRSVQHVSVSVFHTFSHALDPAFIATVHLEALPVNGVAITIQTLLHAKRLLFPVLSKLQPLFSQTWPCLLARKREPRLFLDDSARRHRSR